MFVTINHFKIHYHVSGAGTPLLLLHGWGAQLKTFEPIHQHLEKHFRTYSLDFPGFGQSDPPPQPWGTEEYTAFVTQITNAIIIV